MTAAPTAGQEWAAAQLEDLRAVGFTPSGWARLVNESLHRAADRRDERPRLAAQSRRWGATGALATVVAWRPAGRRTALALAWWTLCWSMLDWHLGMAEDEHGRGAERLHGGDALTLGRLWLAPGIAYGSQDVARAALAGAAASDLLDGILARRSGPTRLGRDLDSGADLATLVAACARPGLLAPAARGMLALRITVPAALTVHRYFADADRPAWSDARATRLTAPALFAGLGLASGGRRRSGTAVVCAACATALAITVREARAAGAGSARGRP